MRATYHHNCSPMIVKNIFIIISTVLFVTLCGCEQYGVQTNKQTSSSTYRKEIDDAIRQEVSESINEALDSSGFARLIPSQSGENAPSNPALQVVSGEVGSVVHIGNNDYADISFTVKNLSDTTITKLWVFYAILDKDGNILKTGQAGDIIRVAPGKSITLTAPSVTMKTGFYSVIVDYYQYYFDDSKGYEEYVDNSPVIFFP